MKQTLYSLALLTLLLGTVEAHEVEQPSHATGFRESFLKAAFPLTKEILASPATDPSVIRLDFSFPVSGPAGRSVIDPTPPVYFDAPPYVGATTILG